MLEKSFGLFFFLKQPKNENAVERYVYLRITVDGTSKELSTKRLWEPSRWSQEAGRAIGTKEDARALNNYLDVLSSQVYQAKQNLLEGRKPITAEALKNLLTGSGETKRTILAVFKRHNEQMKALVGSVGPESRVARLLFILTYFKLKYKNKNQSKQIC
ncbi:MAG: Arm DNA-binding domain-containing protein [Mucilaginibacter sp.]|uniref:Arm DNA-binding domain-containing protein n=1 Tax=Mucilaginibacter sp. TaxID=1882438 RepID=UPI00326622B9